MSGSIEGLTDPPVELGEHGRAHSQLWRLRIHGRPFFVLKQRGAFADIAYDHGRLLAAEIEGGCLPEIVSAISRGIDRDRRSDDWVASAAFTAYSRRIFRHTSLEFRQAAEALADGYRAERGAAAGFAPEDLFDVLVAVEAGSVLEGLYRLTSDPNLLVRVRAWIGQILLSAIHYRNEDVARWLGRIEAEDGGDARPIGRRNRAMAFYLLFRRHGRLRRALQNLASPRNRCGYACTGVCAPADFTADRSHIHARNFDAEVYRWNDAQVLALIDETDKNGSWHKYAALGTAGLIYPGGISGMNDAGLAASIHEMSTTRYRSGFMYGSGDIAPFVQQRILREAATLDEAADIARTTRHFGAWTLFCSHAASGEALRIEFNGENVRVVRSDRPTAQSNHFTHPDMLERHFDHRDAHFTPTFGKWLETHARYSLIEAALSRAAGGHDAATAVGWLGSGVDWNLLQIAEVAGKAGAATAYRRSFGRVPRKVYCQMTSVVRADPARRPGHDEIWVTLGDRRPASHGGFVGWKIDWEPFAFEPLERDPVREAGPGPGPDHPAWEDSLGQYIDACIAVARPRYANGTFMMRDPRPEEYAATLQEADARLTEAVALAGKDGAVELPYHYMRARIRHELGAYEAAREDWDLLGDIWSAQAARLNEAVGQPAGDSEVLLPLMHPYEAALALALSTVTEDAIRRTTAWDGRADRLRQARHLLHEVRRDAFGHGGPFHRGIADWLDLIDEIERSNSAAVELPHENFVTVE